MILPKPSPTSEPKKPNIPPALASALGRKLTAWERQLNLAKVKYISSFSGKMRQQISELTIADIVNGKFEEYQPVIESIKISSMVSVIRRMVDKYKATAEGAVGEQASSSETVPTIRRRRLIADAVEIIVRRRTPNRKRKASKPTKLGDSESVIQRLDVSSIPESKSPRVRALLNKAKKNRILNLINNIYRTVKNMLRKNCVHVGSISSMKLDDVNDDAAVTSFCFAPSTTGYNNRKSSKKVIDLENGLQIQHLQVVMNAEESNDGASYQRIFGGLLKYQTIHGLIEAVGSDTVLEAPEELETVLQRLSNDVTSYAKATKLLLQHTTDAEVLLYQKTLLPTKHLEQLLSLQKIANETFKPFKLQDIEFCFEKEVKEINCLVYQEKKVVGGAVVLYDNTKRDYLDKIVVDSQYQGQRFGSRLMDYVVHQAKKRSMPGLRLSALIHRKERMNGRLVTTKLAGAHKVYHRKGFQYIVDKSFSLKKDIAVTMILDLKSPPEIQPSLNDAIRTAQAQK